MFSIFNSLVKQFHGFLSQAVLLNLLREILSKTQNEEIMSDHIGFGGTPTSCLLGLPQHIQVYRLYQIFSLNEKSEKIIS